MAIASTVPASGGDPGIEVNLRLCEPDIDLQNDDLLAACNGIPETVEFQIALEGQLVDEPSPDGNGFFEINTSIGPGTFELKSLPVVGLSDPNYRCLIAPGDGTSEEITGSVPADSPGLAIAVEGTERIFCYYFFQFTSNDQGADGTADESESPLTDTDLSSDDQESDNSDDSEAPNTSANSLTIQFWTCPSGVDAAADQTQLLLECTGGLEQRSLTVTVDGGIEDIQVAGTLNREFADSSVVVGIDPGLLSSIWCSSSWTDNGEPGGEFLDSDSLDGETLTLVVSHATTTIYCDWFLFTD